uniref:Uncharacterized protein n=1 Tax=Panagrolaimus superbus TaxID=310955 RepID=A0A914YYU8_9BILA
MLEEKGQCGWGATCLCGRPCRQWENATKLDAERLAAIRNEYASDRAAIPAGDDDIQVIFVSTPSFRDVHVQVINLDDLDRDTPQEKRNGINVEVRRRRRRSNVLERRADVPPVERRLPVNEDILVTHRPIGEPDIEAVQPIYELLRSPIPRNVALFAPFTVIVNRIWRNRIERYFNYGNEYNTVKRRYIINRHRNGFALFLFERVRIQS